MAVRGRKRSIEKETNENDAMKIELSDNNDGDRKAGNVKRRGRPPTFGGVGVFQVRRG